MPNTTPTTSGRRASRWTGKHVRLSVRKAGEADNGTTPEALQPVPIERQEEERATWRKAQYDALVAAANAVLVAAGKCAEAGKHGMAKRLRPNAEALFKEADTYE